MPVSAVQSPLPEAAGVATTEGEALGAGETLGTAMSGAVHAASAVTASASRSRARMRSVSHAKKKTPSFDGVLFNPRSERLLGVPAARGRRPHLLEAGAAVDGLVAAGLERHACLATAVAAGSREELTRATHAPAPAVGTAAATHATGGATRRTAGRATSRLVHEAARGVELLLAGRPCEFLTAVFAGQSLVREAQFKASSLCCSRRLEPRQDLGRKCLT